MVAIATDRLTKVFHDGTVAVDDVSIEVRSGEFMVLLGPTGCGKSTILRLVAGLEEATSGHVLLDGVVADRVSARERRVAMVFQDYPLYPHLTVAQNIGFPLRAAHEPPVDVAGRVAEVAEHLGITELLRRLPGHLSGGQRQRVAMARAIIRRPRAFLLDEPLSNVDAGLRAELRADVATLARRLAVTTLYVTHDQSEALAMADRVAILRRGRLEQSGPPAQVYADPTTVFVAAFLGTPRTSLLQAAVYADSGRVVLDLGPQVIELPRDDPRLASLARWHTDRVTVALRADALTPVADATPGPLLRGAVRMVENLGHEALVHLATGMLPTSGAETRLELPDPARHLSQVLAEEPPSGQPLRHTLARMIPRQRQDEPPATARTEFGFYPAYDPALPGEPPAAGEIVVRVPAPALPREGEQMTLAVDLDRMLLFDRTGARIRLR
ncbi:ABC transporter ATP-binding protein [Micromonospora sp. NPDC049679]|uniref:ABC transporter ATP-binding protein n=1 Tax=Micromonospora sp. NPDC049679 TaxID=3155920 RepID=UPI0033F03F00